ncbi:hypothetical protein ATN84_16805 [Paramesorhizobium deserti]|uniref:Response regulatory domain-containing protein n=1 Tax=Paramesorhizobium deserti TaxID=1494590 RepID=A0A135HR36_9HYPH|nr:response regulator transcription factor [Paramesorhizobium deserti]KXF75650.1 hypothetical protein ATN84_16805 [Paramesorhizobium deserti]
MLIADTFILIVASDPTFRQSLAFVLEAEGCRVDLTDQLPIADETMGERMARYDCIVVDDRSVGPKPSDIAKLRILGKPVVLLVNHLPDVAEGGAIRLVEKPLLGRTLVEAVRALLGRDDLLAPAAT